MFKCSSDFGNLSLECIYLAPCPNCQAPFIHIWCVEALAFHIKINFYYISLIFSACTGLYERSVHNSSHPVYRCASTRRYVCVCSVQFTYLCAFQEHTFQHLLHINVLTCECITYPSSACEVSSHQITINSHHKRALCKIIFALMCKCL